MGAHATGLSDLIDDLQKASDEAVEGTKKIVGQGSNNVKKDAQAIIRANSPRGYLPHYPRAISYDVTATGTAVTGEIGPKYGKQQARLGPLLERGTVNSAPIPHLSPALDAEEPRLARYMEELGAKLLEGQSVEGGPVVDPGGG